MISVPAWEGFLPFREYQTFYRVVGDLDRMAAGKVPILALHGRPPSHEALTPLEKLSEAGRPVIFYDQLGCGRSGRPDDPEMWTMSLFVEEVDAVRRHLNLEQLHLLGHSWGGMVALEYALGSPGGLTSLILASTMCDRPLFESDFERLREELPTNVFETLLKHEAAGTTNDPEYEAADRVFALRHCCRVDPWPEYLIQSLEREPAGRVNTDGWTVQGRLNEIVVPTLITCGRYDFATPAQAQLIHNGIRGSELIIFEESSHYAHIEETERYLSVLDEFMTRIEEQVINIVS